MRERITAELDKIRAARNGLLMPEDVVEFARDPATELHSQFEWDDTEAARLHRLNQARTVIRLSVTVVGEAAEPTRAFFSLPSDRANGGGYRSVSDVMGDDGRRAELLADALARIGSIRRKYSHLQELSQVWREVEHVERQNAPARAAG